MIRERVREALPDSHAAARMPSARAFLNGSEQGFALRVTTSPSEQRLKFLAISPHCHSLSWASSFRQRTFWLMPRLWAWAAGRRSRPAHILEVGAAADSVDLKRYSRPALRQARRGVGAAGGGSGRCARERSDGSARVWPAAHRDRRHLADRRRAFAGRVRQRPAARAQQTVACHGPLRGCHRHHDPRRRSPRVRPGRARPRCHTQAVVVLGRSTDRDTADH